MGFEVKALKFNGKDMTTPCKTFEEAKALAIERASRTGINQEIKPVRRKFQTYIITGDGLQINKKTKAQFRIKGFHGCSSGLADTGEVRSSGGISEDDMSGCPATSNP